MKIITATTLTALMLGTSQAEYTVKIPLEQDQGGNLPSQSIQIKHTTTVIPTVPEAPVENGSDTEPFLSGCRYEIYNYQVEYYSSNSGASPNYTNLVQSTFFTWEGEVKGYIAGSASSFSDGEYRYYVNDNEMDQSAYQGGGYWHVSKYYEICREPI